MAGRFGTVVVKLIPFNLEYANLAMHRLLTICFFISLLPSPAHAQDAGQQLHKLFESQWQRTLRESPTWASDLGDRRYNRLWSDASLKATQQSHQSDIAALAALRKIGIGQLSNADQLNYRLFERELQQNVDGFKFGWNLVPLNQRGGIQTQNSTADSLPFDSIEDYADWIARLEAFPVLMDQTIARMKAGIERGIVHPKVVMKRIPAQIRAQIVDDPKRSPFFSRFRTFSPNIEKADRKRLTTKAVAAISDKIIPSYRKMLTFFESEYLPACFDKVGAWQLPDGQDFYAFKAKQYTTTNLTPQQIHDIGQSEVKRIRAEMMQVIEQVKFEGTFREFLDDLRTNKRFYFDNPDDLLAAYRECCKRIDPQLPRLFKRLPKISYDIQPIPMQTAPDTTTAYYRRPSPDGSRLGTYFVNLYKPGVRPKYEIEALSAHEAVPGHHFQIALAMELDGLPEFRRYGGYTAFIEGWGLYSEKLGEELGLYKDPYSKFGQLTYEMWRAVRLVVDTGMHSLKWDRDQAIDFFAANTAKTLLDIENEVDRYIAWPGQALAYKIGELKIRELRARAEKQLGEQFDIKDFHEVVLENGAVTLDVLESNVDAWIQSVK